MTVRSRIVLALLWASSLVAVAQWRTAAQAPESALGLEVRFLQGQGKGGTHAGILVANFGGQWLPVTLDKMPDANGLFNGLSR